MNPLLFSVSPIMMRILVATALVRGGCVNFLMSIGLVDVTAQISWPVVVHSLGQSVFDIGGPPIIQEIGQGMASVARNGI